MVLLFLSFFYIWGLSFYLASSLPFSYLWHCLTDFWVLGFLLVWKKQFLFFYFFFWGFISCFDFTLVSFTEYSINPLHILAATLLIKQFFFWLNQKKNITFFVFTLTLYLIAGGGVWNSLQTLTLSFWVWDVIEWVSLGLFLLLNLFSHQWAFVFVFYKGINLWYLLPPYLNKIGFFFTEHHLQLQLKTISSFNTREFLNAPKPLAGGKTTAVVFFIFFHIWAFFSPKPQKVLPCLPYNRGPRGAFKPDQSILWLAFWHIFYTIWVFLMGSGFVAYGGQGPLKTGFFWAF